ncbi:glycosyltransferase [Candidatus Peregrinibacteria bacterium]|nr:glycosyltransferase [Candidatus Peregrinibacteria bacterium]
MTKPAIHQFAANLSFGDAISNDMLEIKAALIRMGYESRIYAQYMDERMSKHFNLFNEYGGDKENLILFHASIGGEVFDFVKNLPDKKIMIYHNMTPPEFLAGYNDHLANLLTSGPMKIKEILPYISYVVGDSDFNRRDIVDMGFDETKTDVLPIFVDFQKYDRPLNVNLQRDLKANGMKNILFVGRFVPNKCHEDLIKAFYIYHRHFNKKSRLILIGNSDGMENYYLRLRKLVKMLEIEPFVVFGEHVDFDDLATYYKSADLFLSMSEHEGFLVPVLECFHLGIPFLAYKGGAVSETMGGGGVLFEKKDFGELAKMMHQIIIDEAFKKEIVGRQRDRVHNFHRGHVEKKLEAVISKVLN